MAFINSQIPVTEIILSFSYWSYHHMDKIILFTDYWKSTKSNEWGWVDFRRL